MNKFHATHAELADEINEALNLRSNGRLTASHIIRLEDKTALTLGRNWTCAEDGLPLTPDQKAQLPVVLKQLGSTLSLPNTATA